MWWDKAGLSSRRWARKASRLLCALALAGMPVWGQPLPQPPLNSDLAFRLVPTSHGSLEIPSEVLKEQPLIRLLEEAAVSYLGFDVIDDLAEAFDGTVVGAVLSDSPSNTSLAEFMRDQELRSQHDSMIEQLRGLAADLEAYKTDNETYPEDFRKYIDEVRYFDVYLSDGASYEYQRTENGQGFRLVVSYAPPSRLGELGPPPVFASGGEEENVTATTEALSLDFVFAARIADTALARKVVTELMGEPSGGFWRSGAQPDMVATLRGPWLVVSNEKSHLGPFLKTLSGQSPGLAKNPRYGVVARNIDMNAPIIFYADLPHIVEGLETSDVPSELRVLELFGPAGYAITPRERSQLSMEMFMGVNAPKGSELEKVMAESAHASTEAAMQAGNIPWDVSNVVAVDYRRAKRLLNALVALSPEAEQSMDTAEDVWAGFLGLDAEAGFDNLVDGWVIVSFERLDIFVNAFEEFFEAIGGTDLPSKLEGTGGPPGDAIPVTVSEDTTPSEVETSSSAGESTPETEPSPAEQNDPGPGDEPAVTEDVVEPPSAAHTPRIPFTVAFKVTDEVARTALTEALGKQLGEGIRNTSMSGVDVVGREDGLLSYAVRDDWFYISGGKTQRLLRNLLAAATGRKAPLTGLSTWAQFRAGKRGEVLAIGHQKVDALYSMVKGFLLFMGPDFRPLAYELGGLRDYHSAVFLVPDGVLLVSDVLQGDGE